MATDASSAAAGEPRIVLSPGWEHSRRGGKIAERLARQIVDDILRNELQPQQVLPPEAVMTETYQVGRGTLREALRLLEVQGLISIKPGPRGGPVVAKLTPSHFASMAKLHLQMRGSTYREMLDARLAIEPIAARLAAVNADEASIATLRKFVAEHDDGDHNSELEWHTTSISFHGLVGRMSGNSVLDLIGAGLREIYTAQVRRAPTPESIRRKIQLVHVHIAEAICSSNADEAERLMREHMREFAKQSSKIHSGYLDERVSWD